MQFFFASALYALLSSVALAQNIAVSSPADQARVTAGTNIIVEVDRPNSLSGSTEVAVVIGLQFCLSGNCIAPSDELGTILYNGAYKPELINSSPWKPPHQNFTVTIPTTAPKGIAQLGVAHIALIGAGQAPFLETKNVTLNIV